MNFIKFWKEKRHRNQPLLGLAIGILMAFFYLINVFKAWDWKALDFYFDLRSNPKTDPRIVLIAIDDRSVTKIGKWPWATSYHAKFVDILAEEKPAAICFDILFDIPDKTNPENDKTFAEAVKKAGNVFFCMGIMAEERSSSYFKTKKTMQIKTEELRLPIPVLRKASCGYGYTNIFPEPDAINRRLYLAYPFGGQTFLSFSTEIAAFFLKINKKNIKVLPPHFLMGDKLKIRLDSDNEAIINFYGGFKAFTPIPYTAILEKDFPEGFFKDKIIIIGGTASGLFDFRPTPFSHNIPGVEIQCTILNNILYNQFLRPSDTLKNCLIIILMGLFLGIIIPVFSPLKNSIISITLTLGFFIYSFYLFAKHLLVLPVASIFFTIISTFLIVTVYRLIAEEYEKKVIGEEKTRYYEMAIIDGLTQLFVVRYFRQVLTEEMKKAKLKETPLSLIMIDIDNFKSVNDTYGHQQGDIVLRETAQIIKKQMRSKQDMAARYGGEEMAILLPNTLPEEAFAIADRVRKSMAENKYSGFTDGRQITGSFGVATYPLHAQAENELIDSADSALYESKHTGKNKVTLAKVENGG